MVEKDHTLASIPHQAIKPIVMDGMQYLARKMSPQQRIPTMAQTRAQQNRAIRQDELRKFISERGKVDYLIDCVEKIEKLDSQSETFSNDLAKYKTAAELRYKLLGKYLPELKSQEITGEGGGTLEVNLVKYSD